MTLLITFFAFLCLGSIFAISTFTLFLGMVLFDGNAFNSPAVSYEVGRIAMSVGSLIFNYLMFEIMVKIEEMW